MPGNARARHGRERPFEMISREVERILKERGPSGARDQAQERRERAGELRREHAGREWSTT
jgi:hypothetical protein